MSRHPGLGVPASDPIAEPERAGRAVPETESGLSRTLLLQSGIVLMDFPGLLNKWLRMGNQPLDDRSQK